MFSENISQFHDHSTLSGKLSMYLNKINWKYVPGTILMTTLVIAGLIVASSSGDLEGNATSNNNEENASTLSSSLTKNSPVLLLTPNAPSPAQPTGILRKSKPRTPFAKNPWNPNKISPPGTFESEGCENGLMNFEGFGTTDKLSIKSLKLRDLIVDASKLTKELQGWDNLEEITIENAWVSGDFSRVYLPKLQKFIYHQFHNDKTDSYKVQEKLKSILFFDKIHGQQWDLEKDVLNLNITIQVTIGGTKLLQIEPEFGDILINTHYCEDILKHFNGGFSVSTLSLHWCPVTNSSIDKIPKGLNYLYFNNAVPSNEDLSKVVKSLNELKELHTFLRFHCDWPGYEIYLNVSELSPSVETVSVTNLDLSYSTDMVSSIQNLSIATYLTPGIVDNFDKVFQNLKTVAIFNLTTVDAYPLLQKILKTPAEWILVTNLTRVSVNSPSANPIEKEIETFLTKIGVPTDQPCFLIENLNGTFVGRSVSPFERNYYRYTRLAFDKIDTYEDYMIWDSDPK